MRGLKRGDIVRLVEGGEYPTDRGCLRLLSHGWEFEVVRTEGAKVLARDELNRRYWLAFGVVEFVRVSPNPPDGDGPATDAPHDGDDSGGGPVGTASAKRPEPKLKRKTVRVKEAA